jgi:DNA mismatch repair protein MutL
MEQHKIEILDKITADQIAAGEVVERPGSVVKELLENSLDAGATKIQLDIDAGGVGRIRVLDNGEGISRDEVKTAFLRHATSKMRRIEDLDTMATFGFRGEALPSIASVSKLTVRTRRASDIAGYQLVLEGGIMLEERDTGCPVGTEMEIRELFFNTPARLKFLKKETTEAGHCADALVRAAAVRPDVTFVMRSSGRIVREMTRVEKVEERVSMMFPKERLVRASGIESGIEVLAVLGPPETARAGAMSLFTYVNGRFIRDKVLLRALTQAFGGTLENGRYPSGLLHLTMPQGSVDVNVHPQKIEVRFADTDAVYRAVSRVVGEIASRGAWSFVSHTDDRGAAADRAGESEARPYQTAPSRPFGRLIPPPAATEQFVRKAVFETEHRETAPIRDTEESKIEETAQPEDASKRDSFDPQQRWFDVASDLKGATLFSDLRLIGQTQNLFLLFEDKEDLVVVDQHAAHERVTYERLRSDFAKGGIPAQRLLMPHSVDLGPSDAERIINLADDLMILGLEVTRSGPDRITIRQIPAELHDASPDRLLADMVLAVEEGRKGSKGDWAEKVLSTMACHNSIRAGRSVDIREIDALLKQMDEAEFKGHCPHGRPVLTRIPFREIRRRLGRS